MKRRVAISQGLLQHFYMGIRFSFDLGTNSIGWAVWRTGVDPRGIFGVDAPLEILRAGVRIFKDGRNPKSKASLASERRAARLARRTRDRFKLRREDLLKALAKHGLFPEAGEERLALAKLDPYELRARAVNEALATFEIGRALFHLHQRRGFKSQRKGVAQDEELGKIAAGTERLKIALAALGCSTLGEFLWQRRGERKSTRIRLDGAGNQALYEFYPTREIVQDEFQAIWSTQAAYHPAALTEVAKAEIEAILFRQRPIKPPPVGKCSFTDELRAPKALPSVAAREIYERLNHLRIGYDDGIRRPLSVAERDLLATELLRSAKLTFPGLASSSG